MTDNVIALSPDDNLSKASELMSSKKIRHIPIVNENQNLVGLITQHDVLKAATSCLDASSNNADKNVPVSRIMITKVRTISPNERLKAAGLIMEKYKYGCIPVLSNDKLIGIITDTDFVGVAINLIEQMDYMEESEEGIEDEIEQEVKFIT
ncbi:MAG: CBS domain-containing protein [Pseudomonadota bacterium]